MMKNGQKVVKDNKLYTVVSSTRYNNYIFVINNDNVKDVKIFTCLDELIEVIDKKIIKDM